MGWACVALEKNSMERTVFFGAANNGTVSIAEMLAYLVPLSWYAAKTAKAAVRLRHIHIITDSQYVQTGGDAGTIRHKNVILWTAFSMFNRMGYQLHWHWLRREDAELNKLVDVISRESRVTFKAANIEDVAAAKHGLDKNTLNPWE